MLLEDPGIGSSFLKSGYIIGGYLPTLKQYPFINILSITVLLLKTFRNHNYFLQSHDSARVRKREHVLSLLKDVKKTVLPFLYVCVPGSK